MRVHDFLMLFAIITVIHSTQYVPISKTPYGLSIGDPEGVLHIQAFYDLACRHWSTQASTLSLLTLFFNLCSRQSFQPRILSNSPTTCSLCLTINMHLNSLKVSNFKHRIQTSSQQIIHSRRIIH